MSDEGKDELGREELLEYLDGHIPTGWKVHPAYQQICQLIQQKPEIDEAYVEEKVREIREIFQLHPTDLYGLLEDCRKFITQIISDVRGKKVGVDEAFIEKWATKMVIGFTPNRSILELIKQMLAEAGIKIKK